MSALTTQDDAPRRYYFGGVKHGSCSEETKSRAGARRRGGAGVDYLGWIIVALDNCCNGDLGSVIGHVAGLGAAMRGTMDGDVAAERRLNAIKDLLEVLPRSRGFRVSLDGNVSSVGYFLCSAGCITAAEWCPPCL